MEANKGHYYFELVKRKKCLNAIVNKINKYEIWKKLWGKKGYRASGELTRKKTQRKKSKKILIQNIRPIIN